MLRSIFSVPLVLGLTVATLGPHELRAQTGYGQEHERILSVNPLALIVLEFVSVEYEQVLGPTTSWGVSGSFWGRRDRNYFSTDAKVRYYPGGDALEGIAVGALLGFTVVSRDDGEDDVDGESGGSRSAVGLGFSVENQWLLGDDQRLALAAGVGGKRLFYFGSRGGSNRGIPFVRLSLGWAF
jgi:hypothetical protein